MGNLNPCTALISSVHARASCRHAQIRSSGRWVLETEDQHIAFLVYTKFQDAFGHSSRHPEIINRITLVFRMWNTISGWKNNNIIIDFSIARSSLVTLQQRCSPRHSGMAASYMTVAIGLVDLAQYVFVEPPQAPQQPPVSTSYAPSKPYLIAY